MNIGIWKEFWSGLEVGGGIRKGSMEIFPLFHTAAVDFDYLTLEEAIASEGGNGFRVEEVSEGGDVNNLRVVNGLDRPVLVIEGELLVGAKQHRTIHTTILIDRKSETVIPVACVEAGRWENVPLARFGLSSSFAHSSLRSQKLRYVAEMRMEMGAEESARAGQAAYPVNQSQVWQEVGNVLQDAEVSSETSSAEEVYSKMKEANDLPKYDFDYPEDCTGLAVAVDGHLIAVDCFGRADTMKKVFGRLVQGYAAEALRSDFLKASGKSSASEAAPHRQVPAERDQVKTFLDEVAAGDPQAVPGIALGTDIRAQAADWSAAILGHQDAVLHAELFPWGVGK